VKRRDASFARPRPAGRSALLPTDRHLNPRPSGRRCSLIRRSAIGAVAPDGGPIVLLDGATTGTDPVEAERAFEKEARSGPLPNTEKLTIAGLPAVHAAAVIDSRRGPLALDVTWIAYAGRVYRVIGIAPAGRAEAFRAAWRETAVSFRPLTTSERRATRETRLRIAGARHGETIGDVVRRAGSGGGRGRERGRAPAMCRPAGGRSRSRSRRRTPRATDGRAVSC